MKSGKSSKVPRQPGYVEIVRKRGRIAGFDDVILDPPYMQYRLQEIRALLRRAIWIARRHVWWFGTCSIIGNSSAVLSHVWLIRVGDQCATRCLQQFSVHEPKIAPCASDLVRGDGLKYRKWAEYLEHPALPFPDLTLTGPAFGVNKSSNGVYLGDL